MATVYTTVVVSGVLLFADSLSKSINQLRSDVTVVRSYGTLESASEICELAPDLLVVAVEQLCPNRCIETLRRVRLDSPSTRIALLFGENHARDIAWLAAIEPEAHYWSLIHVDHVGCVAELSRVLGRIAHGERVRIPETSQRWLDRGIGCGVGRDEMQALRSWAAGPSPNKAAQRLNRSFAGLIRR